jgi:DNA-binding transcriptional LysR family regulator
VKLPPVIPDLVSLDLLLSVAEYGSLGQAGRLHEMSQPAVSMRMAQLERQMGLQLLERTPSGTSLTHEGVVVADWARRVVGVTAEMMAAVSYLRLGSKTGLRVASSVTVADHLLAGWLVALRSARPGVDISLEVHNTATVLETIEERKAELGFIEGASPPAALNSRVMANDHLTVVVGPGHPWARRRRPVTGEQLAATPLIVREKGSGTRDVLERALAPWGGTAVPLFEFGSNTAILGAVRRNEGPAVISALAIADDIAARRVIEVPTVGIDLSRKVRAVWRRGHTLSEPAQRLLRVVRVSVAKAS